VLKKAIRIKISPESNMEKNTMKDLNLINSINKLILNEHYKDAQNYIIENNVNLNSKGTSGVFSSL
jgi:hypothetical protein